MDEFPWCERETQRPISGADPPNSNLNWSDGRVLPPCGVTETHVTVLASVPVQKTSGGNNIWDDKRRISFDKEPGFNFPCLPFNFVVKMNL